MGNGNLEESARGVSLAKDRRHISYLANLKKENGTQLGYPGNTTDYWHSDQEFRLHPASITLLYCVIPTATGGETSFASTLVEHLDLDKSFLQTIQPLWSTRKPAESHDNAPKITVSHPLFLENQQHPSLYISENTLDFIDKNGSTLPHSNALKKKLLNTILTSKNLYSHKWRMGDILIFDNSKLIHRREAFNEIRFLKGIKIYPDDRFFTDIKGKKSM